jgi:hypothetical protein
MTDQFDDAFSTRFVLESIAWPVSLASVAIPRTVLAQDERVRRMRQLAAISDLFI